MKFYNFVIRLTLYKVLFSSWISFLEREAVLGMGSSDSSIVLIGTGIYLMKVYRGQWGMLLAQKYHS